MGKADAWLGNTFPLSGWVDDVDRAVNTGRLIADKSTSITVIRAGAAQAVQTVRIEPMGRPRQVQTEGGQTALADTLVLGYFGHPTITDADLQTGDRFAVAGVGYEIVALLVGMTDSLQAFAMVRS